MVGWQGSVGVELLRAKALTQLGRQHEALQAARAVLWCVEEEEDGGSGKAGEEACALVWDAMEQLPPLRAARYRNASSGSWGSVKHEEHLLVLGYMEEGEAEANASWPLVVSSRSLTGVTVEVCGGLADVEARLQEEEEGRVVLVAEARSTVLLSDGESVLRRFREGLRDRLLLPASEQQEQASSKGPCDWAPTSLNAVGAGAMLGLAADVRRVVAWAIEEEEGAGAEGLRQALERLRAEQLLGRRSNRPAAAGEAAWRG